MLRLHFVLRHFFWGRRCTAVYPLLHHINHLRAVCSAVFAGIDDAALLEGVLLHTEPLHDLPSERGWRSCVAAVQSRLGVLTGGVLPSSDMLSPTPSHVSQDLGCTCADTCVIPARHLVLVDAAHLRSESAESKLFQWLRLRKKA